jgi:hypothetical protein
MSTHTSGLTMTSNECTQLSVYLITRVLRSLAIVIYTDNFEQTTNDSFGMTMGVWSGYGRSRTLIWG